MCLSIHQSAVKVLERRCLEELVSVEEVMTQACLHFAAIG